MTMMMEPPAQQQGGEGQNAIAVRRFQPLAKVGSAGGLKSLLEAQRNGIAQALPKHVTPERLIKTLLVAANRNPQILDCTQASILETINRAAELGLDLSGTLGEAYPVPFNNKVKTDRGEQWLMQLQLIIGYRGMEKLAWQSGDVESIDAEVVREKDHFVFRKGTEVNVEWSPALSGDRGDVVGAYACIKMKAGGKLARFLPKSDIEKIRAASKSKDSPAWRNWWDEMARKCALKRTLKDAPLSTERFVAAMEHDESDFNFADVLEAQTRPQRGTTALAAKLKSPNPADTREAVAEVLGDTQLAGEEARREAERVVEQADQEEPFPPGSITEADAESSQQPEPPEGAPPVDVLDEAIDQGPDAFKKSLYAKAKEMTPGLSKATFEGGYFKFVVNHGGKVEAVSKADWRTLYAAIAGGSFDYKSGAIVGF
jgi:recombination protein RecT